ncbi:MAG: carboxypeptidase regulatory-like domain-containing protein [Terracidiphilus sp.]|nr:carboxypeptidase regulatory-like domain-containing protein [Terracidiphilus sp.]
MALPLHAQTVSGTVTGTITDASGAILPSVTVKVTNTNTSQIRSSVTNAIGLFSIPALPPGPYTVEATANGFQQGVSSIILSVGQILNVNFQLKVGSTSEKVEVVANESTGLETQTHDLTAVMDAVAMENMPEYAGYRNATFYAQTTEVGVQPLSYLGANNLNNNISQYNQQSNALAIGGNGYWSASYLLDGVVDMSYFDQTATVNTPPEATEQVEIIRNSANARYDGANVLNAITKSGTEKFHGRAYDNVQNNAMNARGWGAGPLGETRYNLFGADAGWTVPWTHKKVFFFVDYGGYRHISAAFLQTFLPTAAERNGDFSADLVANSGTKQPATKIYDPTTYNPANGIGTTGAGPNVLTQFAYNGQPNVINPALITPLAKAYLNLVYPLPNGLNTSAGNNYGSTHAKTQFHHDNYLYRVDYNINEKDHLYGAFNTNNPEIVRPEFVDDCICAEPNQLHGTDIYIEESHVISPTLVNTGRVGFARSMNGQQFGQINNGTDYFHKVFGLTGLNPPPAMWGWPGFNVGGYSGPSGSPLSATQNMYEYSDELNLVRGKHSMFFGIELDDIDYNAFWYTGSPNGALGSNGQYTYNGSTGAAWQRSGQWLLGSISGTFPAANELADYLLGYYSSTSATAGSQVAYFHQHNIMPYFQDDWRVTPKLTLNLGMRYDSYSPPTEAKGHAGYLDPTTGVFTEAPWDPNKYNFSPRAGFAYSLNDKTSIHGGGGIYFYQFSYYDLVGYTADPLYNTGLNSTQSQTNPVIWPASNTAANPNTGAGPGAQEFFTIANAQKVWAAMPAASGTFVAGSTTFAKKMPTSYSEQWNLAVQHTFGQDILLTVDYIGSEAHHIFNYSNINQASLASPTDPNPGSTASINARRPYQAVQGNIIQDHKWGQSNYHALETQLKKRFGNGFEFNTNFVWQKSMDYQDSDHKATGEMGNNPRVDYGRSDFMQKYVYKVSGIYELPFGKNKRFLNSGKWWQNELGGWRFSGFMTVYAGPPFNVTANDNTNTGGGIQNRATATCNGNNNAARTWSSWFNTSCYTQPAVNTFGNERRNDLDGPRNTNIDLSVFKEFQLWDNLKFQWRTNAYSALNHPLPNLPQNSVTSGTFGQITSFGAARTIELSAKILW